MPRKAKILVIFHLCLAFTALFWFLLTPLLQEVLVKKEEISLFESVIGQEVLFSALPAADQRAIREGHALVRGQPSSTYFSKFTPSLFPLLWVITSIGVALLFLFRIEGSVQLSYVLPLIIVGYGVFVYLQPVSQPSNSVFPTEEYVVIHHGIPGKGRIGKKELKAAWQHYLIDVWAKQEVSEDPREFSEQLKLGTFAFNKERVQRRLGGEPVESLWAEILKAPPSSLLLLIYFGWNLFFVLYLRKKVA